VLRYAVIKGQGGDLSRLRLDHIEPAMLPLPVRFPYEMILQVNQVFFEVRSVPQYLGPKPFVPSRLFVSAFEVRKIINLFK
jgi:hypothetical protein